MPSLQKGILISVEGIDGSGKTTLAHNLYQQLKINHFKTILTKEPGGTEVGRRLREILQTQEIPLATKAEFLLFAADRAEHFSKVIVPHLDSCFIVISDRLSDSSVAYQGYGRGLNISTLQTINAWAMQDRKADITFYVQLAPETASKRLIERKKALTCFEIDKSFTKKVSDGFDTLFANRQDVITLDATQSAENLTLQATNMVLLWIKHRHLQVENSY